MFGINFKNIKELTALEKGNFVRDALFIQGVHFTNEEKTAMRKQLFTLMGIDPNLVTTISDLDKTESEKHQEYLRSGINNTSDNKTANAVN